MEGKDKDCSYVEDKNNERSSESTNEEYKDKKLSSVEDKGKKHPSDATEDTEKKQVPTNLS